MITNITDDPYVMIVIDLAPEREWQATLTYTQNIVGYAQMREKNGLDIVQKRIVERSAVETP